MKLLFDENLSPKLPEQLAPIFPDCIHIRECGMLGRPDDEVWEYARENGFTIISKDSDFQQRSLLHGLPPKIVWLRTGNCTRAHLLHLIVSSEGEIRAFGNDPTASVLVLS